MAIKQIQTCAVNGTSVVLQASGSNGLYNRYDVFAYAPLNRPYTNRRDTLHMESTFDLNAARDAFDVCVDILKTSGHWGVYHEYRVNKIISK